MDAHVRLYNRQIDYSILSDLFKDAFGSRPRHEEYWTRVEAMSDEELQAEMQSLSQYAQDEYEWEQECLAVAEPEAPEFDYPYSEHEVL